MLDESESEPKGAVDANIDQSTDNTIETVEQSSNNMVQRRCGQPAQVAFCPYAHLCL
jgi:hypothetical protein